MPTPPITPARQPHPAVGMLGLTQFTSILDHLGVLVVVFDPGGHIVYWNQPCAELTGLTLEEAARTPFWDWLLLEEDGRLVKQRWASLDTPLFTHQGQSHWRARDGGSRLIQWSNAYVRDANGRIEWIAGTGIDVTEREANARQLRSVSERYISVWETANDAIILVEADTGRIADVNPQSERMLGLPKDKIIGMHQSELHPPDTREEVIDGFRRASEGALPLSSPMDVFVQSSDGRRIPVEISSGTFALDGKRYVQGIFRDLSEYRKVDLARRRAEGRSAAILKAIPDMMFALSPAGVVIDYHAPSRQGLTAPPKAFLDRYFGATLPPDVTKLIQTAMDTVRGTGVVQAIEYAIPVMDGTARHFEARIAPVEEGGFLTIVRDVTDKIKAQRALVQQAEDLKQARLLAEQANEAKSAFLAAVSHEIRTPLNSILGFSGLVMGSPLTADQHECLEQVRLSGHALLELINDILDISAIEADHTSIENAPFDLCSSVEEALGLLAVQAEEKCLDLVVRFGPNVPCRVYGDPSRLSQVLLNLVSNANKFTDHGVVRVEIDRDSTGGGVRFSVTDSGPGIPEEKRPLLFQKFNRLGTTASRKHGGTGLGLHISKRLVEMMGGKIGMDGAAGGGASFWFTVPLSGEAANAVRSTGLNAPDRLALVADPSPHSRAVLGELCRRSGLDPVEAQSCEDIARLAADPARRFAIVFFDLRLPGHNAQDFLSRRMALPSIAETPFVLIGGWRDTERIAALEKLGAVQSLRRPVFPLPFQAAVAAALCPPANANATSKEPALALAEEPALATPIRVLLVEDNPVNQKLGRRMLDKLGCHVDQAANGSEAVLMANRFHYDLILMDVQMPEMDGYDATAAIRQNPLEGRRVPIVAMTANALKGDQEKCLQAGMDDYLSKPVSLDALRAAVNKWSQPAHASAASA